MPQDLIYDVERLSLTYGATPYHVSQMSEDRKAEFWRFRVSCIAEELDELLTAESPEEAVDAIIDLTVFALGTLVTFGVGVRSAWAEVHRANMAKEPGVKPERPNPFGLPDLIKPDGWKPPDHTGNTGLITSEVMQCRRTGHLKS